MVVESLYRRIVELDVQETRRLPDRLDPALPHGGNEHSFRGSAISAGTSGGDQVHGEQVSDRGRLRVPRHDGVDEAVRRADSADLRLLRAAEEGGHEDQPESPSQ